MREIRYLFIDNGGVMTDNAKRSPQLRRLVSEFLPRRLGGSVGAWAEANSLVIRDVIDRYFERLLSFDRNTGSIRDECDRYYLDWLRSMCQAVGLEAPASDEASLQLALEADAWMQTQAYGPCDGSPEAVRELARKYRLFTASDGLEFQLRLSLGTQGIVDCFERLYGPDLVNTPKSSPDYHARIFADAGVDAAHALVIDDNPEMLRLAIKTGAFTVLVSKDKPVSGNFDSVVERLADLPELLMKIGS